MKEEWLLNGAAVPVTCETVTALVAEIHRLIDVVGGIALAQPEQAPMHYYRADAEGNLERTDIHFAQPEHEPVAWYHADNHKTHFTTEPDPDLIGKYWQPLYPSVPQRTWVGLTDEEQQQAYEQWQNEGWGVFYKAIEAKLKEKNT